MQRMNGLPSRSKIEILDVRDTAKGRRQKALIPIMLVCSHRRFSNQIALLGQPTSHIAMSRTDHSIGGFLYVGL